ncbi:All-trans-phytoene synthase [Rubripirellula tenax]|uniref:All-trans-phytoene synthase n=2 Tax=Rubripirellula tenax TaxID=2528015 RepID=A0A5C6FIK5_9BACT|nr:All-trans-phytoene synthase [Rubripirellula tenax]
MCAVYAFARITDDLGDCSEPAAHRAQWLQWWRQVTAENLSGNDPSGPLVFPDGLKSDSHRRTGKPAPIDLHRHAREILPALRDASTRYQIPSKYLLEIIDGVAADQQKTRFDTYEQLEHYCYLVASAVGLTCLHIWEYDAPLPVAAAIDCGLAFQLTNILRDISEDAQRGRIYLPRQHYQIHGLSEDDFLSPRPDDRLRCLVEDEIERARRLFESGWQVWDSLHPDGRPMFSMMWRTYRMLLDHIAEDPNAAVMRRVGLSRREKYSIVTKHFLPPLFRRLPVPPVEFHSHRVTES